MLLEISKNTDEILGEITISGSKSESNRLLILQALFSGLKIENLSNSDDTKVLQKALLSSEEIVDIHHAGTAMRFLAAYFSALKNRQVILTGSQRMQERPIKILVDALKSLGAQIEYLKEEGFPPLQISGKHFTGNKVSLPANISSQYISALMLIAPSLPQGLEITLEGTIISRSYIEMTLQLLKEIGIEAILRNQKITIAHKTSVEKKTITVEPDWSSASYFYSIVALSNKAKLKLFNFKKESLQGDAVVAEIYRKLGVKTAFEANGVVLEKINTGKPEKLQLDLNNSPDLAQTIAITCLGLGIECHLTGLQTLKIKETDRLLALKNEIEKFGASVVISNDSISFSAVKNLQDNIFVETYNDHRMAMAFAPLSTFLNLKIKDYKVVSKSYPRFWEDLEALGFQLKK